MAYDGVVISNVINDIKKASEGGRVLKIQQPSSDVITITIKGYKGQTKLYISCNASLPIVYIADTLPPAPMQAPAFCMLLRKHLGNGRLIRVEQPGFDRVFDFVFEHMDEMGDIGTKHLIVEIMGRQSNIILLDGDMNIIDSMKRVMPDLSDAVSNDSDKEVRILYPGQEYKAPEGQGKIDIVSSYSRGTLSDTLSSKSVNVSKAIFTSFTGFSKGLAEEIVYRSDIDARAMFNELTSDEKERVLDAFEEIIKCIKEGSFNPCIAYVDGVAKDYHSIKLTRFDELSCPEDATISRTLA